MPIKNILYNYKIECIEIFLDRAFMLEDKYSIAQQDPLHLSEHQLNMYPKTFNELEHVIDIVIGYQNIVFRAVYSELNALIELELKRLAKSILTNQNKKATRIDKKKACSIIESETGISIKDLPNFENIDEIRKIANSYKHADGFISISERLSKEKNISLDYQKQRYNLSYEVAKKSIQKVKEFMKALPGERQNIFKEL